MLTNPGPLQITINQIELIIFRSPGILDAGIQPLVQAALSKFGLPCAFLGKSDLYSFVWGNIYAV